MVSGKIPEAPRTRFQMAEGSSDRIKVLIADDHRMFRDLVRRELAKDCDIVGEATDGQSTLALALRSKPHVILLDVIMRGIDGLSAAHELARKVPDAKVLVLSQYENPEYVLEALKDARVAGYFLKTKDSADNILPAIRAVYAGGRYLSPSIAPIVLNEMNHPSFNSGDDGLTKREREVLRLIAEGSTMKEIAV